MKLTVLVDTNILMVSLSPKSNLYWMYQSLINDEYNLVVSTEILLEYEEQIAKRYDETVIAEFILVMTEAPNIFFHSPFYKWNLIEADADDNKFADCAISFSADYLITHDKHFNILKGKSFPVVNVINAFEFKEILKNRMEV